MIYIYNSRNYYRLLNRQAALYHDKSTTVEITIGYLTSPASPKAFNLQQ